MKKFLSLVLAMIMTMSLVTISAGATEYKDLTDKDEIQYEEAVAVLNRIGVITGYDDGSFRPEGELTRGAAAKIIVSLLIGPEAANNLPNATAPYPDVPASHTFAGVISYCKTAGIISGYGDGTFKPGNSLTGFAFAKMLLGALGYKSEIEGFVDTGWTMNVAKVGNVVGLFDRLDFDGAASVNREEACQLALNTLKATMVTYGGTTMVTGAQNMFVQGTQAMYVTSNNREINANINRRVINAANNELTLEFGEEHFKDLRLEHDKYDPAYDDYGHPSNEWSWKKVTIGTFKLPADFTYTNQVAYREDTVATKEKALGLRGYDTYSTDHRGTSYNWSSALGGSYTGVNSPFADATQITVNGWNARVESDTTGTLVNYDAYSVKSKDGAPTLSEIADLTDNGVTVEVYVCPVDADFITNVVVTRTQLMKVKRIGSDYVTVERISPDSRDPRKDEDLKAITGYNAYAIDVDTLDVKDNNFDAYNTLKDLKSGDRVAVIPFTADQGKTWEVGEAYVPETVSGKLSDVGLYMNTSKRDGNATSITVGGTKYVINEWNLDMIDVKKAQINATRKDVTAYLAKDGTVLWATEIGNSDAWMIVGDYYQAANTSGKVVWFAHGWTIGGEEVDVDLGTIRGEAEKYAPGELVHYALADGGTGEYKLEKPNVTGKSHMFFDGRESDWNEPILRNDKDKATGEGIYNVAQFVLSADESVPYEIHPANSLIPLENYSNEIATLKPEGNSVGGAIFGNESDPAEGTNAPHDWSYRSTTYKDDGVKFIYVSFDAVTGNVDYVSVRKDAQSVDHDELTQMNWRWKNVGTNVQWDWVISPAEAYVNDEGNVEAVVIKCEPAVADLSNIVIVGEYVGAEYGKSGAETTTPTNTSAREYWQGPNFSEKKTGYFKNGHDVGDVVVIRSTDANGVMDCKMLNGGEFENRNPDVFASKGITALKSAANVNSKIAFYVGNGTGYTVKSQDLRTNLIEDNASIMSDKQVEADNLEILDELNEHRGYKGLIKVAGAKWIDLRANRGSDEVESLGDLLDLDPATVELHVLLNAKDTTDNFRRAYAIVVLAGESKKSVASVGTMSMRMVDTANFAYVAPTGTGTSVDPWVFEVETLGQNVTLEGLVSASASKIDNQTWRVNDFSVAADSQNRITFTAPATEDGVRYIRWTVSVHDNDKDIRDYTATCYAEVRIKDNTPVEPDTDVVIDVADLPEGVTFTDKDGNLVEAKDGKITLEEGETYTLGAPEGFTVSPETFVAGTTKVEDIELTEVLPTGFDKIEGVEGAEVVFAELDDPSKTYTAKVGESVELPTGVYLTVSASDSANHALARKNVGSEPVPYANAFKIENVDSVLVYVKGTGSEFSPAWDADATNGGNGLTRIPKAAEAGAAEVLEETLVSSAPAAGSAYVKVTTPDGVAFLSAETTGKNAGLFSLVEEDADGNKCPVTIADVAAALNESEDNAEDVTEDDVTYGGDEPGPGPDPELPETVKAEIAGDKKITFFKYKGEAMTDEEVQAALKAAIDEREGRASDKVEIGSNGTTVTATFGAKEIEYTITKAGNETLGASDAPQPLYKVTVGTTTTYVKQGGDIEGLTNGDHYINTTTPFTDVVGTVASKKLTVSAALTPDDENGDPVYDVELVKAAAWPTTNVHASNAGKIAKQGKISWNGKETVIADLTTAASYMPVGADLTLYINAVDAGKSVTYLVNGEKVVATNSGDATANVQLGTSPIEVALNKDGDFVIEADTSFQIKLNGAFVPNGDSNDWPSTATEFTVSGDYTGMSVFALEDGQDTGLNVLTASNNMSASITGGVLQSTVTIPTGVSKSGVVELYTGYMIGTPTADFVISAVEEVNVDLDEVVESSNTDGGFITCKPGETPTLYVTAKAASVVAVKDGVASPKIDQDSFTEVVAPVYEDEDGTEDTSKTVKGVYSFKVTGDVTFATEFETVTYVAPTVTYTGGKGPALTLDGKSTHNFSKSEITYIYTPLENNTAFDAVSRSTLVAGTDAAPAITLTGSDEKTEASAKCGDMIITAAHEGIKFVINQEIKTTGNV